MAAAKAEGSAAQDSDASHPVADVEAQGHEPTARTQRYIRHENLMRVLDHWTEDDKEVYVTEIVVDGTVEGYVNRLRGPDVKTKVLKKWGRQILSMLNTLHTHLPPVALGDIRPDNIFINSSDGSARVAALRLQRQQSQDAPTARGRYSAPDETTISTPQGDIYSFGLTLLQLASQATPYWVDPNETFQVMWEAKRSGQLPAQLRADSAAAVELKAELKDFIVQCLHMDALKRPTATELLQHMWLKKKKKSEKSTGDDPETPLPDTTPAPTPEAAPIPAPAPAPAATSTASATAATASAHTAPVEHKPESQQLTSHPPAAPAASSGAGLEPLKPDNVASKHPATEHPAAATPMAEGSAQPPELQPCPLLGITLDSFSYRGLRKVSVQISLFYEADEASIKYRSLKFQCSREEAEAEIGKLVTELIGWRLVRAEDKSCLAQWLQSSLGRVLREPLAYTRETVA